MTQTNGTTNGTNGNGLREKITLGSLPVNVPNYLTLDSTGVAQEGKTGLQYRYMLNGNRITWVDPAQHDLIQRTGAQEGDTIQVIKRETRNGNRKGPLDWQITLASEQEEEPPDAFDQHMAATAPRAAPPQARPAAPVQAPPATAAATSPRHEPATAATASVATLPSHTSMLSGALVAAIDAANTAESYAEAHSRRVTFTSEDLRAMGLSIYISLAQGRRA